MRLLTQGAELRLDLLTVDLEGDSLSSQKVFYGVGWQLEIILATIFLIRRLLIVIESIPLVLGITTFTRGSSG